MENPRQALNGWLESGACLWTSHIPGACPQKAEPPFLAALENPKEDSDWLIYGATSGGRVFETGLFPLFFIYLFI